MMKLFPFKKIRPGQKEFLQDVKKAVKEEKHLIAHAPTGIGKTAAVLASGLQYALKKGKTLFFLTPKHTQHKLVVDTLRKIKRKYGVNFIAVDFIGKQWLCPHDKVRELSSKEFNEFCRAQKREEKCKYYKNAHKEKLSENAKKVLKKIRKENLHSEEVRELCRKNAFCPYEMCIKAGKEANVIICDYFHIFSPKVRKAFLSKLGKGLEESILIVDEAHNLPDRVRKILSHRLSEFSVRRAMKEANFFGYDILTESYKGMQKVLKDLGKNIEGEEREVEREEFMNKLEQKTEMDYEDLQDMIDDLGEEVLRMPERYRSYSKAIARFMRNWKKESLGYVRILRKKRGRRGPYFSLSHRCLDPGISTEKVFQAVSSDTLMSGTLIPLEMYAKILELEEGRTLLREYESPFPQENRLLLLVPGVTTRYKKRTPFMYQKYGQKISQILQGIPRNAAVFFPSYQVMRRVMNNISSEKEILQESKRMKKEERISIYNRLENLAEGKGGILAGVQAGSLSEGMDYKGNLLDAVIIVGLPLEVPSLEVKSLIKYYDFKFDEGWNYGYIYPAMNRALQAAGRCIRSEREQGAIILMDERFKWKNYSKCFPRDFSPLITEIPEKYVKKFFTKE